MALKLPSSDILAQAPKDTLSELFSRDPFDYQQQDISRIVQTLREQRAKWNEAENKAKKSKEPSGPLVELSSEDL